MLTRPSPLTSIRLPFAPPAAGGDCAIRSDVTRPGSRPFSTVNVIGLAGRIALALARTIRGCRLGPSVHPHDARLRQEPPRVVTFHSAAYPIFLRRGR